MANGRKIFRKNLKELTFWIILASVFILGVVFFRLSRRAYSTIFGVLRTLLYVGFVTYWLTRVRQRIVQPKIRILLIVIAILMILWFTARAIRYDDLKLLREKVITKRYLWYSYYIPMMFLPTCMLMTASYLGKSQSYRLSKRVKVVLIAVTTALVLLVFTNDLHQAVFGFPSGIATACGDDDYTYNFAYYFCIMWLALCIALSLIIMVKKSRIPNSKKIIWLPLLPIIICACYGVLYILRKTALFNDIVTVDCFSLIAIIETAIAVGLIPSNGYYAELFRASDKSWIITDENFNLAYASKNVELRELGILKETTRQGSIVLGGKRLSFSKISGGYVFWQDDITKLLAINEELEGTKEELRSYGSLLEEENKQKKRRQKLIEQQLLYEKIRTSTLSQQKLICELSEKLQQLESESQARKILQKITVVGAYVKRRSNLTLLSSKSKKIRVEETELCIKESMIYLKQAGISCAVSLGFDGEILCESASKIYDFFESAVELSFDTLKAISVFLEKSGDGCLVRLIINCDARMTILMQTYSDCMVEFDGDTWFCGYNLVA